MHYLNRLHQMNKSTAVIPPVAWAQTLRGGSWLNAAQRACQIKQKQNMVLEGIQDGSEMSEKYGKHVTL